MFCHKCGNQALEDAGFCQKCGAKLIVEQAAPPIPSEPVPTVPPPPIKPTPPQVPVVPVETAVPEPEPAAPPTPVADPVIEVAPKPVEPAPPPRVPVTPVPTNPPPPVAPVETVTPNPSKPYGNQAQTANAPTPNHTVISMEKLSGALCIALSVLLFLSAAIWAVIIFNQVSEEVDFGTIVWNIVATVASIVLGVRVSLFAAKKVESSADKAGSSNNKLNTVGLVLAYSVIGIVFYGDQYFNMEEGIMLFPILIEAATLLVSIPATFILHRLNKINKKHWEQMIPCKKCLRTYDKKLADCPNCGQTNPSLNTDDAAQPVSSEPIKAAATKSAAAPTPPNPKKKISKGLLFGIIGIAVVAVVAIVVVIVLSLGGADDYGYDPPPSSSVDYSELLTQTYTNEEEGFAFKYPGGWDFENDDDSIVSINTAGLSFAANIGVAKGEADDEFFSATKGDFLDFYSEEFDELNIVSLSDVYLDGVPARKLAMTYTYEGVSFVGVQHFYKIGSDMYIVSCLSLQSNFDEYEPIFDAIMDSYRITRAENKTGSGPSNHDDAYNIAQAWLDAHPDFDMAISGGSNDLYQADGEEYYLFYLDYRHDILVHSKTGALLMLINYDGENPYSEIEPLDDWYNKSYKAGSAETRDTSFTQKDEFNVSASDEYLPRLTLHPDGSFTFRANFYEGMGNISGTYSKNGNNYTFNVTEGNVENFTMLISGDTLIYESDNAIGMTTKGAVFYKDNSGG